MQWAGSSSAQVNCLPHANTRDSQAADATETTATVAIPQSNSDPKTVPQPRLEPELLTQSAAESRVLTN